MNIITQMVGQVIIGISTYFLHNGKISKVTNFIIFITLWVIGFTIYRAGIK